MPITGELIQGQSQPYGLLAEGINRAYVYEGALANWAITSKEDATEVLWFMAAHKLCRTVIENNLGPLTDQEGAWEGDSTLDEISELLLASDQQRYMNPFFKHAAVTLIGLDLKGSPSGEGSVTEKFVPIGGPLYSSCFDQHYHTYAFDGPGNKKMRDEEGPMKEQAEEIASGEGARDLALVNGQNGNFVRSGKDIYEFNMDAIIKGVKIAGDYLTPVEWDIGLDGTMEYVRQARPEKPMPLEEILALKDTHGKDGLDRTVRSNIMQIADVRIGMVFNIVHKQQSKIGSKRYEGRLRQLEYMKSEGGSEKRGRTPTYP